ncbi:hypothetical protein OG599_03990 [Streptomyces sp. NBC_01335]|uniref:hypothetical protein n=1 Tax=Streptomyces sp. NBC_01335 TaxID=2903828 RepID=UPI002E14453B|nr:hypothetical protein OG599_03990 [Streptomyces sp. NBC_01335]
MNEDGRGPSAEPLLALIGEHRASIREALDDTQYALLLTRLGELAEAPPEETMAVRRGIRGVELALRPLPFTHPLRAALDRVRLVAAPPGPETVSEALRLVNLFADPEPEPGPEPRPRPEPGAELDPAPAPGPLPRAASGSVFAGDHAPDPLLGEPALSAAEARARCGGAPPPELIRLLDPPNGDRYPEFQFPRGSGTPHEVVLTVNRLLLADIDPRGAASWWLGSNTWLGGSPASLLGRLPDQELVGAAVALVEGE